jgi:hypothetical protein
MMTLSAQAQHLLNRGNFRDVIIVLAIIFSLVGPGAFNHVNAGGIPKRIFFQDDSDRYNLLGWLVTIVGEQTSAALPGGGFLFVTT